MAPDCSVFGDFVANIVYIFAWSAVNFQFLAILFYVSDLMPSHLLQECTYLEFVQLFSFLLVFGFLAVTWSEMRGGAIYVFFMHCMQYVCFEIYLYIDVYFIEIVL